MHLRTVLCPVDFSDTDQRELDLAVRVGQAFGARLVVHHNHGAVPPALGRQWDYASGHIADDLRPADAKRRMQALLKDLPRDVAPEGVVTTGPIVPTLTALAEQLPADLVVLGSHGWGTAEHASVMERVIRDAPCPVITFDANAASTDGFRLATRQGDTLPRVVVPTDFSAGARHAAAYAYAMARCLPMRIELLHVLPASQRRRPDAEREALAKLDAEVPPDLTGRVEGRIRWGNTVDEIRVHLLDDPPAFVVVGEHTRDLLRHFVTKDTTRAVVHSAPCPVWVVPQRAHA